MTCPTGRGRRLVRVGTVGLAVSAAVTLLLASSAADASVAHSSLVTAVPSTASPNITDGATYAIAKVGNKVVVGGSFTKVTDRGSSTSLSRNKLLAFDATTGKVDTGFLPALVGTSVNTLLPGPNDHSVYVGGVFTSVHGTTKRNLALVDTGTGALVTAFKPAVPNGAINVLRVAGSRLLVGGTFTKAGTTARGGLASMSPTTGALDSYLAVAVTGHHNYAGLPGQATSAVGVTDMDVSPDARTLVVIGNFRNAGGVVRDQIARIRLDTAAATVDPNWATSAYAAACTSSSFDSYVRGISFSPDGAYFVVVSTGGPHGTTTLCDAAARFETAGTGSNVTQTWADWTGGDTLWSVAVTGAAVYVGGHQRWLNNPEGGDSPGQGAVPRPGIGALDPRTGVPVDWNPGRQPRGVGARALLATTTGLYVGQDTNYIGNRKYLHGKIAYFPLTGGSPMPVENTGTLPGTVYNSGSGDTLLKRAFDGAHAGAATTLSTTGVAWSAVRDGFMVNGTLYYARNDDMLARRTFNGTTFGAETLIDPYNDPVWSNVQTGSGQTYRGTRPSLYAQLSDATGLFYSEGHVYYTLAGSPGLYARDFSPHSGIVGEPVRTVSTGLSWSATAGMFLAGGRLYYGNSSDGNLRSVGWSNSAPAGTPAVVSGPGVDGQSWKTRTTFLYAGS